MNVFQRYGVMEYGSIYGHGAYLGPDFTADYLHRSAEGLRPRYLAEPLEGASAEERVGAELHANTYEPAADRLVWTDARAAVHRQLLAHYQRLFDNGLPNGGMQAHYIQDPEAVRQLTAFFAWTAWTATANRPGRDYSYTNNWPPEPAAGNTLTADSLTWSVISIIALLGGTGIVLFWFGRYDWLGWRDAPASASTQWRRLLSPPPSGPLCGSSSSPQCCSLRRPSSAVSRPTTRLSLQAFSAGISPRSCRTTSRAPGTSSSPSSGCRPPISPPASSLCP